MSHLSSSKPLPLCLPTIYSSSKRGYYGVSLTVFNLECLKAPHGRLAFTLSNLSAALLVWALYKKSCFYPIDTLKSQKLIIFREDSHRTTYFRRVISSRHVKTTQPVHYKHTSLSVSTIAL